MSNFTDALKQAGIAQSRIDDLELAFSELHRAVAKLDLKTRSLFLQRSLEDRLREYAKLEGMADVLPPALPSMQHLLDLSTCYITKNDAVLLNYATTGNGSSVICYGYEGGWFVVCSGMCGADYAEVQAEGFSDAFISLLKFGAKHNCGYLQLDRDGCGDYNFPRFKW